MIKNIFNGKKKISFYLIIIGVILVGITLGSALLSSTLKVIGNSEIKKNSWIIYFDDIDIAEDSAPNSNSNENASISVNGVADPTKQNIEFTAHLNDPGDFYEFTVYTVNDGTIDAEVLSLEKSPLTDEQKKYLDFDVTYDDGTPIEVCDILYHKGSTEGTNRRLVKAVVKYKKGLAIEDYPTDGIDLNLYFKINYRQRFDCPGIPVGDVKHVLTIRPNGGKYEGRSAKTRKYLSEDEEYVLSRPTRKLYNFDGWDVIDPETGGTYHLEPYEDKYKFTMGTEDVTIEAKWKEGDYVARIMDHYYTKVELAFDAVDGNDPSTGRPWENNTVWLIRDTEEVALNNARSNFTFNLDGHTLTGKVVNPTTGKISIVNGTIHGSSDVEQSEKQRRIDEGKNPVPYINNITGEAILNYGTLTLGKNDGTVEVENSISIFGNQYGVYNVSNSKFNFYDGFVQSREAFSGLTVNYSSDGREVTVAPNHFTFVDHRQENGSEYQKVYLTPSPNRAVAKTTTVITAYYYTLQDAINSVLDLKQQNTSLTDNDYIIDIIRTFEAAYDINVQLRDSNGNSISTNPDNARVFIDLKGYSIQTGKPITNNGYLKIYNSKDTDSTLQVSKTITNNGSLEIDNLKVTGSTDDDVIVNSGALKLTDTIVNSHNAYCVKNINNGTLDFNSNVVLRSVNKDNSERADQYALYNSGTKATINNGTIYGLYNTGTIKIDGDETKYIPIWNYTNNNGNKVYLKAIYNSGNITMNNGIVTTGINTTLVDNDGTFTFNNGVLTSEYLVIDNSGTVNVKGNEITSSRTAISGGTVNIDGGNVRTSSTEAVTSSTINVKNGEVIAEDGVAVGDRSTVNVMGGTVTGTTYGVKGERSSINVSSGTITAPIAADVSSAIVSGGNVIGSEYAIVAGTTNISGGNITSPKNAVVTNNLTMTGGTVDSTNEIGITINSNGNITGGEIYGGTYGVDSKGSLTLGTDDGTISSTTPLLEGELLGLNIQGSTTNFYDGILKGQDDGYQGNFTGLPLGGVVGEGTENRGEDGIYNTDFVSEFAGWLRIGDTPYNTLNAASSAINDGESATIIVTRDADVKFSQKIFDDNKNKTITLDLNGHKITTTQNITNYSNLIIIDSSTGSNPYDDKGDGPSSIKILKNDGIINYNRIEINAGRYESVTNQVIYNKASSIGDNDEVLKGIEINNATFNVSKSIITNGIYEEGRDKPGFVRINGINVETSYNTITNEQGIIMINGTKDRTTGEHTTVINASNYAVSNEKTTYIFGGKIVAQKSVVNGWGGVIVSETKNINLDDENQIASTELTSIDGIALNSDNSIVRVNGGTITSEHNTALVATRGITVNGGYITGTRGAKNEEWCSMSYCGYEPITINGGTIIGTETQGVYLTADDGYFNGGLIIGKTDGIYNKGYAFIGQKGGELSTTSPEIRGIDGYAFNNNYEVYFYDGILKGKKKEGIANSSHYGMIQTVEDATQIKRDYEYIDNVYYETEYLETQGDWLEIEGKGRYNTVDKACSAATSGDTIKVIADTHIAFDQHCESGKVLTFDENGHSVSFTYPITFNSEMTFIDSVGHGLLSNRNGDMIITQGNATFLSGTYEVINNTSGSALYSKYNTTITGGTFKSGNSETINNAGTMIFNDVNNQVTVTSQKNYAFHNDGTLTFKAGNIKTYGGVNNDDGTFIMDGGTIEGTNNASLRNTNKVTINGGTLINNTTTSVDLLCYSETTINGGSISSSVGNAISIASSSCRNEKLYVNDGEISGQTNGISSYYASYIEINGGNIKGVTNNGVYIRENNVKILGGTIEGGTYGVYTKQEPDSRYTQLGENDGNVSIDSPNIKGELYGLYIESGTLNFYDGVLKGQNEGYYGQITNIATRTQLYYDDDEIIDEVEYQVVYLLSEKVIVRNIDKREGDLTYTDYTNLQDAFDAASNGDRLVLLDNAPIYYSVTNNKNVSLDMAGYSISTNKRIINNGELEINNTSENESSIKTSAAITLITNNSGSNLKIDNVSIKNNNSNYYVIQSPGKLELSNVKINGYYGVNASNNTKITNSQFTCSKTALNNTGKLDIIGGTYNGSNYSIYSNTSQNVNIKDATIIGTMYNSGSNTSKIENSILNGELQNSSSNATVFESTLNRYVSNSGTMIIDSSSVNNSISNSRNLTIKDTTIIGGKGNNISNSGTLTVKDSSADLMSNYCGLSCPFNGVYNTGTATFDNVTYSVDKNGIDAIESRLFYNSGTLTIQNNTSAVVGNSAKRQLYAIGVYSAGSGVTNITDSNLTVQGTSTGYGLYVEGNNSKINLKTGNITCNNSTTCYGAYINHGTLEMGIEDGSGDETADVSITNPNVTAVGSTKGIAIKKINGFFNFYDGRVIGSRFAKPETTSIVEKNYEVTTYVDENTGYEFAYLEYMQEDYIYSNAKASITVGLNTTYYPGVREAVSTYLAGLANGEFQDGVVITLLQSNVELYVLDDDEEIETPITIPSNANIKLNLNGRSITTQFVNNGHFEVYNGSVQNFEKQAIINNGTLIMGQNDGTVSSTNIRVISEVEAIKNNGTLTMYDGYLEGNPSIVGEVNEIAPLSRIYTVSDAQSEKKYLQSLDENSIRNKETALFIEIDPLSGFYNGVKGKQTINKFFEDVVYVKDPIKNGCTFLGWNIEGATLEDIDSSETDLINQGYKYKFTVGITDVKLTAKWQISELAVAKIGEEYYNSVADAIMEAKENDTVEIIKDVTEDVSNNKNITLDLGGYKLTGEFINTGILRVVNGTIENEHGIGIWNKKTLILGENDVSIPSMDSVRIIGTTIGIKNDGGLRFYDGYVEGDVALVGDVDAVPQGYSLYIEHNSEKDCQREYLIGNPENAVAITKNNSGDESTVQYFFSLQDAIESAQVSGKEIFIIKDFNATYPITTKVEKSSLINLSGHTVQFGTTFTNNGTLKIYDTTVPNEDNPDATKGSMIINSTINNNGTLTIEDISLKQNKTATVINSTEGSVTNINAASIETSSDFAITNGGELNLSGDISIKGNAYGIYNTGSDIVVSSGFISGIKTEKSVTVNEGATITATTSTNDRTAIWVTSASANVIVNGGTITSVNERAIQTDSTNNVTINGGTITGVTGLYCKNGTANYVINGGTITGSTNAIYLNAANCNLEINGGTITSSSGDSIYIINNPHTIKMTGGYVNSTSKSGFKYDNSSNNSSSFVMSGGTIEGKEYGAYLYGTRINMTGGEIKTNSSNSSHSALRLHSYSGATISGDSYIHAPSTVAVWMTNDMTISGNAIIESNASNGNGIYSNGANITLKDNAKIITTGTNSVGIQLADNNYTPTINIEGGEITSANIGIHTNTNSSTRTINVKNGKVSGETYGIYQVSSGATTNIGLVDAELSTTNPLVSGGLYGIYKTTGNMNFYNGRLKGYTYGYNDNFNNVRSEKEITKVIENLTFSGITTYSTDEVAAEAISDKAKSGNGHARLTYIGETVGECTNGKIYDIPYSGSEYIFNTECSGKYKIEVWGAAGGYSSETRHGGYGGYATGQITLALEEKLYINVGGQGTTGNPSSTGGYNGGGYGGSSGGSGGGGGATHIATKSGLLSTLENDKSSVIIVAGGGGGYAVYGCSTSIGGNGGGYYGSPLNYAGTQEAGGPSSGQTGGSFGKGGYQSNTYHSTPGAGAGWYGGGTESALCGAGGGSGYIGNTRLSNSYMYGYDVKETPTHWITNYLIDREDFIQVGEETFNSINNAQAAIEENTSGTMILLKDVELNELSTIAANKDVTLDLNGHTLTITRGIVNHSNLTIVDSSTNKTGKIDAIKTNAVATRNGSLTLDGVTIKSVESAVYIADNAQTINIINDTKLEGKNGINSDIAGTIINFDSSEVSATTNGIICSGNNTNITVTDSTITSSANGIKTTGTTNDITITNSSIIGPTVGVQVTGSSSDLKLVSGTITSTNGMGVDIEGTSSKYTMTTGTITAKNQGLKIYAQGGLININGGTITSTSGYGLDNPTSVSTSSLPVINVNGGTITGATNGAHIYYADLKFNGGEINTTSTSKDNYAIYSEGWGRVYMKNDAFANAPQASGVRTGSTFTIADNAKVYAGASNGYGVYVQYVTMTMTGGTIETSGKSSYGIYHDSNDTFSVNIKDGTITSENIGINLVSGNNVTRTLNITGGTIEGKKYGLNQTSSYTTTIGDSTDLNLNVDVPYITGGLSAINKTSGTLNFYDGKLRGYHKLDEKIFTTLENKKMLYTTTEVTNSSILTNTINTYLTSSDAISNYAKEGDGYARLTYLGIGDNSGTSEEEQPEIVNSINCADHVGEVFTFDAIKQVQELNIDCSGEYKIELWGAQGGYRSNSSMGGPGGYVSANVNLLNKDHLYIYVGSEGNKEGYNGGGSRSESYKKRGGGGATDVRLSTTDLYTRFLVAAGGGSDGASNKPGGAAGGIKGESRTESYGSGGSGATQEGAGSYRGTFGVGGSASGSAGAGGGGWYGGGGANPDSSGDDDRGGGGGSSYVYTSTSFTPTGYSVDPRFQAISYQMSGGRQEMPTHDGTSTMTGNIGDGYAKITFISSSSNTSSSQSHHTITLVTSLGELDQDNIDYAAGSEMGALPTPDLIDEGYIFDGWYLDKNYTKKVNEHTIVNASATLYAKFKFNQSECASLINETFDFKYTGNEQVFTTYCTGDYKLEVWGAQGGKSLEEGVVSGTPGFGGYSTGIASLIANEKLYINVGGQGETGKLDNCAKGGYNGGGYGTNDGGSCGVANDDDAAGGGGGATHIAKVSGLLSSLENNRDKILIVAGGGGGVEDGRHSGSGGGNLGGRTEFTIQDVPNQTTGYSFGKGKDGSGVKQPDTCTLESSASCGGVAGGGGGYYGGYSQDIHGLAGGTGGSGYIKDSLTDAIMYQYHMDTKDVYYIHYLTDKEAFLEVNNVGYNSFEDALAAAGSEGTIKVIKSVEVQEAVSIDLNKNITIDMNGKTLTFTKAITNNGDLTVTNGGKIVNNTTNPIINKGNLTVGNVEITSSSSSTIYGNSGSGTITINGAKINSRYSGILVESAQKVIVNSGDIFGRDSAVKLNSANSRVTVNDGNLSGIPAGIANLSELSIITVNGGNITGSTGILDSSSKGSNKYATYNINGGKISGKVYGINVMYATLNTSNAEIITTSTSNGEYAINCNTNSTCNINNGTIIKANSASGIRTVNNLTITDVDLYTNHSSGYGIYVESGSLTMNGGTITTKGYSSNSIFLNKGTITLNDGNINSKNRGITTGDNTNSKTLNIYGGNILAENYGIYQNKSTTLKLGNSEKELNVSKPYVEGGLYGLYDVSGTLSFYSGTLKGATKAYKGNFTTIRERHEIFETFDGVNATLTNGKTFSTTSHSDIPTENTPKEGNGYAKITYSGVGDLTNSVEPEIVTNSSNGVNCTRLVGKEYTFEAIEDVQTFIPECNGEYKIEVWGAQGGYRSNSSMGGHGGYTSGLISLEPTDKLFVYVGSEGNKGGYNGGGSRSGINNFGGGATDIRLTDSLYSRIIVAGGGGSDGASSYAGGAGGGLNAKSTSGGWGSGGSGATQTSGGSLRGTFGYGGNGYSGGGYGGAGGGGWYGGGGATPDSSSDDDKGGGGGSSFIYNDAATLPTGYIPTEKYKFYDTKILDGTEAIPSHDGTSTMTGNTGDGYAKITFVKSIKESSYSVHLETNIGTISNDTLTYNTGTEIGNIPAPIVNDNTIVFDGWYLDQAYTKKIASTYKVKSNLTLYAKFNLTNEFCSGLLNDIHEYSYTGGIQEFKVMCPGTYKLEVWGAQGGNTTYGSNSSIGGYGGYSKADITLTQGEKLYIAVGGQGNGVTFDTSNNTATYDTNTGYNGGGYASYSSKKNVFAGGGGATHIALKSGLLSSFVSHKNDVLIVAGGGGGSTTNKDYPSSSGTGGSGGGYTGGTAETASTTCSNYGTGGTQSSGGSYVACSVSGSTTRTGEPSGPTFGKGANYTSRGTDRYHAGGGSGWYGGQSGYYGPGGGGSGYTGSSRLSNTVMYGYNVTSRYSDDSFVAYLVAEREFIKNIDKPDGELTYTTYTNLQDAINDANSGDTLQLMSDSAISYEVTFANKELTLDLDGHNFTSIKQINVNDKLNIVNSNINKNIKINSSLATTLFILSSSGTINIDGVNVEGKNIISGLGNVIVNDSTITSTGNIISGANDVTVTSSTLNTSSNTITCIGNLNIQNSTLTGSNTINNTGDTNLKNVTATATQTALQVSGELTVDNVNLTGSTYAFYNNSSETITFRNCTLSSGSTAVYNNSTGTINIIDTQTTGSIINNNASGTLNINKDTLSEYSLTSLIVNKGTANIQNVKFNYTTTSGSKEVFIDNSGILDISNTIINVNNTYGSSNNVDKQAIFNSGTLRSSSNQINMKQSSKKLNLVGIFNTKLMSSVNDTFDLSKSNNAYGIYNNSSNDSIVTNLVGKSYNVGGYDYGIYDKAGNLTVNNFNYEAYNNNESKVLYSATSTANITASNITGNLHDNTYNYALYIKGEGVIDFKSGTITASANTKSCGAAIESGDLTIKTGTFNVTATNDATGIELTNGTLNIESATIDVSGTNVYGINITNGVYTQGIYDGRGTESADVSFTDPHISAIGTTSGIGISMGNGDFKFYDGYISGSTSAYAQGNFESETEYRYHVEFNDNGKSCTLRFDM